MRNTKKAISILLTLLMVVGMMSTFAFAQTVNLNEGDGSIKITNPVKEATYKIYKILDAQVKDGSISYKKINETDIGSLSSIFTENKYNDVVAADKDATNLTADQTTALRQFAESNETKLWKKEVKSDGTAPLLFEKIPYGYYVVVSSKGNESGVSVTSTDPNAEITAKNPNEPPISGLEKEAYDKEGNKIDSVYAGQVIYYIATIPTSNYVIKDGKSYIVTEYDIEDTLPNFLKDVSVDYIKVGSDEITIDVTNFATTKKIAIPWSNDGKAIYSDGDAIEIKYHATVNAEGLNYNNEGNKNTLKANYKYNGKTGTEKTTEEVTYSYALAIKKINENAEKLTGAEFEIEGYNLVKVSADTDETNVYVVTGKDSKAKSTFVVGTNGQVIIKGVDKNSVTIKETKAPKGYNILLNDVTVTPSEVAKNVKTGTIYIDENGDVTETKTNVYTTITSDVEATFVGIVNKTGTQLPETGGIGTTIFYLIGAILVIGAGVVFVTRRRMHSDK